MDRKYNKSIVPFAKELRKNMTKEERRLWYDFLKNYPIKFTRQKVLGKYIVDFYCARANLVVELDGSQHYKNAGLINDERRTEYLAQYGIKVIRISNLDVLRNFEGVCMHIDNVVKQSLSQLC
ncbi:MAG: endonuclease domain-containing protein [Clostridia bacterium]|nr:endonuclease domain-containing protein [Clostridia bacterium]